VEASLAGICGLASNPRLFTAAHRASIGRPRFYGKHLHRLAQLTIDGTHFRRCRPNVHASLWEDAPDGAEDLPGGAVAAAPSEAKS
jgi:hypothetical protein